MCEGCDRAWQEGGGEVYEVPAEVGERARCDAEVLPRAAVEPGAAAETHVGTAPRAAVEPGAAAETHVGTAPRAAVEPGATAETHKGRLLIEGTASGGFAFFHADGTRYGHEAVKVAEVAAATEAYEYLRAMGMKETEAKRAVAVAREALGSEAPVSELVREALRRSQRGGFGGGGASSAREVETRYGAAA